MTTCFDCKQPAEVLDEFFRCRVCRKHQLETHYITKHQEDDGSTLVHACSYENPCGDQLICRACRYR